MDHLTILNPYSFDGKASAKNRLVLAPMTNAQSHPDGTLGEDEFHWLKMRAEGGFGMLISCAAHISANCQGFKGELGIFGNVHDAGLHRLASMMGSHGALSIAQLYHGGARCPSTLTGQRPISASEFDLEVPGFEKPRQATPEDIELITEDFAAAAKRATNAGFSGVEIHAANGYLITQFLSTQTNHRQDQWGGSLENRARFLLNIVRSVKARVPRNTLVGVRLSPENVGAQTGLDIDESLQLARWLALDGIDCLHLSMGDAFRLPAKYPQGALTVVQLFREALSPRVALVTSGGIWTAADAACAMALGADFVSLGKAAIANPDWPQRIADVTFQPKRLPLPAPVLQSLGIGPEFLGLLKLMRLVQDS